MTPRSLGDVHVCTEMSLRRANNGMCMASCLCDLCSRGEEERTVCLCRKQMTRLCVCRKIVPPKKNSLPSKGAPLAAYCQRTSMASHIRIELNSYFNVQRFGNGNVERRPPLSGRAGSCVVAPTMTSMVLVATFCRHVIFSFFSSSSFLSQLFTFQQVFFSLCIIINL